MLKVGILGCGRIAQRHLLTYKKISGLEIFIADVSLAAARRLGQQTKTAVMESPEAMFELRELDVFSFATI